MKKLTWILIIVAVVLAFGGCNFSGGGYSADIGVTSARIEQDGQTQRARIEADAQVAQAESRERSLAVVVPWLAVVVVAGSLCWLGVAWTRRPQPATPQPPMRLLTYQAQYPGTEVCIVDGRWALMDGQERYRTLAQLEAMDAKRIAQQS